MKIKKKKNDNFRKSKPSNQHSVGIAKRKKISSRGANNLYII